MTKKPIDYKLFFATLFLIIFGMIMISSVSVYSSFKLTNTYVAKGFIEETYNYFYVIRNISHVIIGLIIMGLLTKLPYKFFEKYIKIIAGIILFALLFVLVKGMTIKGASGWINIPGLPFTIQPTEFLKFGLIIFLAAFFGNIKNFSYIFKFILSIIGIISITILTIVSLILVFQISLLLFFLALLGLTYYVFIIFSKKITIDFFSSSFLHFIGIISSVSLLVGLQPDFGTLMVILPVSTIMYFITGANIKNLTIFGLLGVILIGGVYSYGDYDKKTGKNLNKLGYITKRIDNFLAPNKTAIENKTINYQTKQGLIAIGSGGFTGLGFGSSIQKFGYLPEVQGDFIFSVIVEELGFFGAFILLNIYFFIAYRGFYIASHVDDLFAKYSAVGISSWILVQSFINIGVNLNIVPLTGITLPFVSYGGSSMLSLSIAIGFLLNISRYIDDKPKYARGNKKILGF